MCEECKPRLYPGDPLPHWDSKDKHPGWHSRRHRTREAQDRAKATYKAKRSER